MEGESGKTQYEAEIQSLMERIKGIKPVEVAEALSTLESHKNFSQVSSYCMASSMDQTKLFFSRGLKNEIESIYLELAKHLRDQTTGSIPLMNAIFDLFSESLKALFKVPQFLSMN